ncbi:MAG: 3-dehydroquinate synthase [Lachnospiraceae bacterium]|nr:3-dehydroquinate synthase [Lachnospiraceae bacterium]
MITEIKEKRMTVACRNTADYDIVFEEGFDQLCKELLKVCPKESRICIVTDSNVGGLYGEQVQKVLSDTFARAEVFTFPAGEENKNLDTVKSVYRFLIENKFDRKDMLLALGGGVVGDLTGYVAATYLRGIDFVQVPTSLLSQVDSSIGGKTGVDFDQYKNMVGAFKMPRLVYTNISTLKSLSKREFASGMGEVLKAGLIKDGSFYGWLINNLYEIDDMDPEVMSLLLYNSCDIKRKVVEKDPTEQGERALLNFGHTLGHAIEKAKDFGLKHGECVALGCVAAAFISYKRQMLSFDEYYEIRDMFVPFNLPITVRDIDPEKIVELTMNDKKAEHGTVKFILLKAIGKAVIDSTVTKEEMLAGVKEIFVSEEDLKE